MGVDTVLLSSSPRRLNGVSDGGNDIVAVLRRTHASPLGTVAVTSSTMAFGPALLGGESLTPGLVHRKPEPALLHVQPAGNETFVGAGL